MQNYHTHTSYSNVFTSFKDSHMQYENYAKRAKETGCGILSSVEHGFQGNHPRCWEMAQKYGLKFVFGTEAYWVRDRKAADRSNAHIIILARNRNGFLKINEMLSQANEDGFYYVPRVDLDLLCGLNPADVWVTTACVSFWGKVSREDGTVAHHEGIMDSFEQLAKHFGSSLHLEVQAHNTDWQRYVNRLCLSLRARFGLKLVVGCDSHYISRDQEVEREILREESHVKSDLDHERDSGVYEDYPDEPTLRQRFAEQGVLTPAQIDEAITTTDEILGFDDLTYDTSCKLPTIYPELTQERRNQLYLDKVWSAWNKRKDAIMADGKAIYNAFIGMGVSPDDMEFPSEERYLEAIRYETGIVTSTNTSDYFLLDSELVACGQANGGHLTPTGRGSAGSFITNTLLGLSTLDRISFPVKLYPDRFVTAERLQTSLPDIDLNVDDQAPFAEAQEELLGKGHSYPMIAYGTLKTKSAFKLYARAANLEAQTANVVSTQIERYERALQYAEEDDKDLIALEDYVEPKYIPYIENSEPYLGIVVSKSPHPCGYLIYNGDIRSEIGLMRVTSKAGSKSVLCTVIDGATADAFGYVKNDLLVVAVIKINAQTMQRAGLPQYSSQEMILLTANDAKTWDVFANGWTQGINQCQRAATTQKLMQYKPRELRDLCAFVAAIRPGFKTQIQQFLARQRFRYGVPAFDRILRNDSSGSAWMLYQENAMTALNLAGFDMARTYPIIKAISKKKTKVIEAAHDEFAEGFKRYLTEKQRVSKANAEKQTELVWQVIEDSANYSFNACVSGSTRLYRDGKGHYWPTVEEMYRIKHDLAYAKATEHKALHCKYLKNYGTAYSMFDDGRIRRNTIVDIRPAGMRQTYRITTANGASIVCTDNHKFPTPAGERCCSELSIGDPLFIKGEYQHHPFDATFTNGDFETNFPQKGQLGFQRRPNGATVKFHAFRDLCIVCTLPCEECGKPYEGNERFEVHHRDMNRHNNEMNNFRWLCASCHKKVHYQNGRRKHGEKGYPAEISEIISIEPLGIEMTYDIEMADPAHNFVVDSGIVTSNSHAGCVSLDALYGAYLKAHYPHVYYEVLLEDYLKKGNKPKISEIKQEMQTAYGIRVVPCRFRQDNRRFVIDREANYIADSLASVKSVSQQAANALYALRDRQFESFVDVLWTLSEMKGFNKTVVDVLIGIGYFAEFGGVRKLKAVAEQFRNGKQRYTKQLVASSKVKRLEALREIERGIEDEDISPREHVALEIEHYGFPMTRDPKAHNDYAIVEVSGVRTLHMRLYNMRTGQLGTAKVSKQMYTTMPVSPGEVIHVCGWSKRPAYGYAAGVRVKLPYKEVWISEYQYT